MGKPESIRAVLADLLDRTANALEALRELIGRAYDETQFCTICKAAALENGSHHSPDCPWAIARKALDFPTTDSNPDFKRRKITWPEVAPKLPPVENPDDWEAFIAGVEFGSAWGNRAPPTVEVTRSWYNRHYLKRKKND